MSICFNINYEPEIAKVLAEIDRQVGVRNGGQQYDVRLGDDRRNGSNWICVADGNILAMVHNDLEYRKVVEGAMFSIVDSSWVPVFVKRLYGSDWKQYCGSQIFDDITRMKKYRMCFVGGSRTVLDALKSNLTEIDPAISSMKFMELPFCSVEEFDYESISAEINADSPDIIWLSLGAPKQEKFAVRLVPMLKRGVVIPVGAVFNFRSGLGIKRAPQWMVRHHMEFVYRIFSEPGKQLRRCWLILRTYPKIYLKEKQKIKNNITD